MSRGSMGNAEVACAQGWRPARGNRMSPSSLIVVLMLMNSHLRIRCGSAQPTLTLPRMSHSVGRGLAARCTEQSARRSQRAAR